MSIIPGWNRPNANGQNANINDKDYNGPNFKARPLKHWRKQLQVYNYNGPANNSRTATISELERPGTTVYHFTPDCTCVPDEGGNSYIISNNKFGYETKDDDYSKGVLDVKVQNNGFTVVPYDATTAQINDPTNQSAYKIMTGIYNTNCINCSPQGNLIRSGIAFQSQAFFSYSKDKLETRCQTYEQNISTNKEPGCVYFDAQGIPLWPTDTRNGPQVVAPVNYQPTRLFNKPCLSETIYKPSNVAFAKQGAVSGSTRLKKLVSDTTMMNGSSFYSARGAEEANLGRFQGTNLSSNYYVKTKPVVDSCRGTIPTPPIISIVDRDTYSISFTWNDVGNSLCNVVYYTVTYFAINIVERLRNVDNADFMEYVGDIDIQDFLDNYNEIDFYNNNNNYNYNYNTDNIETMVVGTKNGILDSKKIYIDRDNNIRYNIISEIRTKDVAPNSVTTSNIPNTSSIDELTPNTTYLMSATSTNGNGTSIRSNVVLGTTDMDSNIVISIEPYSRDYIYNYSYYQPHELTITLSSDHTTTPIIPIITNATKQNVAEITNVAENTYKLILRNAGTFNVHATQARGLGELSIYGFSKKTSPLITISQDTPILHRPWDIFPGTTLYIGEIYDFSPAVFDSPLPEEYDESNDKLTISYTVLNSEEIESNIVTFIENNTKIRVNSYDKFRIRAISGETQNYKSTYITSNTEYSTSRNIPFIEFSRNFAREFTYGATGTFVVEEVIFSVPDENPSGIQVEYHIIEQVPQNIATIQDRMVTIRGAGTFRILARTLANDVYISYDFPSPLITIRKATPGISKPWHLLTDISIDPVFFIGTTYTFIPPIFEYPSYPSRLPPNDIPSEILPIIYNIPDSYTSIATIPGQTRTLVEINNNGIFGEFSITAISRETDNYYERTIVSERAVAALNNPIIYFPSVDKGFINKLTYGDNDNKYILKEAYFTFPLPIQNIKGQALLSGSKLIVNIDDQYNYFFIGRRITAEIINNDGNIPISFDITGKKIEYDVIDRITKYIINISNISNSTITSATITNIIQTISEPPDFFITYSIAYGEDVASSSGTRGEIITIKRAGTFIIEAKTNQTSETNTFRSYTLKSEIITVDKYRPQIEFDDLFDYTLLVGNTYTFKPANIISPNDPPDEILPITYEPVIDINLRPNIIRINNNTVPSFTVISRGEFRIKAQTKQSVRYESVYAYSPEEITSNPNQAEIKLSKTIGPFTYGVETSFDIPDVEFINPNERPEDMNVVFTISQYPIARIRGQRTVDILNAGPFTIVARTTTETQNYYYNNGMDYTNVIVNKANIRLNRPWNLFSGALIIGQTREFSPPEFEYPELGESFPLDIPTFTYSSSNDEVASVSFDLGILLVTGKKNGRFKIIATIPEGSVNYNGIQEFDSEYEYTTTRNTPTIDFPTMGFSDTITYGDIYSLREAEFTYPNPNTTIQETATLTTSPSGTHMRVNLEQYNLIIITAVLTMDIINTPDDIITRSFRVANKTIETNEYIVTLLSVDGILNNGDVTVQNIRQYISIPPGLSIKYSISSTNDVATISGTTVTINKAGPFTITAEAISTTPEFINSESIHRNVRVQRARPIIQFPNPGNIFIFDSGDISETLLTSRTYAFTPADVIFPYGTTSDETPRIIYRVVPDDPIMPIASIIPNTTRVRINRTGSFRITATRPETQNFVEVTTECDVKRTSNINDPIIVFPDSSTSSDTFYNPTTFLTRLTFGFQFGNHDINTYAPAPARVSYPTIENQPQNLQINYLILPKYSHIATLEISNVIIDDRDIPTPVVTVLRAGTFKITAYTNVIQGILNEGYQDSDDIVVSMARPTFRSPWVLFPSLPNQPNPILLVGRSYQLSPPQFITPNTLIPPNTPPPQITNFSYVSSNNDIASISGTTVTINRLGEFFIKASSPVMTYYYNAGEVRSATTYPTRANTPGIRFPTVKQGFSDTITYGEPYQLSRASFYYPDIVPSNLFISYSIQKTSEDPVASINSTGSEVIIKRAGTFIIEAKTNQIEGMYERRTIYSPTITVRRATLTLTFAPTFNTPLLVGRTYPITPPPTVKFPLGITDNETPNITYRILPPAVITTATLPIATLRRRGLNETLPGTYEITINNRGNFQIEAIRPETRNFNRATSLCDITRTTDINTPNIRFGFTVPQTIIFSPNPNSQTYTFFLDYPLSPQTLNVTFSIISNKTNVAQVSPTSATVTGRIVIGQNPINLNITTLGSGTFQIKAETTATTGINTFRSTHIDSQIITVNRATLTEPIWDPFPHIGTNNIVNTGTSNVLVAPQISSNTAILSEIFPIIYDYVLVTGSPQIIRITPYSITNLSTPTNVVINSVGTFRIRARTNSDSRRYSRLTILSSRIFTSDLQDVNISFNTDQTSTVTFGDAPYQLLPATITNPPPHPLVLTINYESTDNAVATISGTTVTIRREGTFQIKASTLAIENIARPSSRYSNTIRVNRATPTRSETTQWIAFHDIASAIATSPIRFIDNFTRTIIPPIFSFPPGRPTAVTLPTISYNINGTPITTLPSFTLNVSSVFTITATTAVTDHYSSISVTSTTAHIERGLPIIQSIVGSAGNETLIYNLEPFAGSIIYVQANPRNRQAGNEWFAVVNNNARGAIMAYARAVRVNGVSGTHNFFDENSREIPFNNIVTTLMTDMSNIFADAPNFNRDIGNWDTSRVTNMSVMFSNATIFNQPIGNWNTSQVTNMSFMFNRATNFNQPINNWDTSKVENMNSMFSNATSFDSAIFSNTNNVRDMGFMFSGATAFNQLIGAWNTRSVQTMSNMFNNARAFNRSLNTWDVSQVTNMISMFSNAIVFNEHIGNWDTRRVTRMDNMFNGATLFNRPIGNWNTSQVTNMDNMFNGARDFNQPIWSWNVSNIASTRLQNPFTGNPPTGFSTGSTLNNNRANQPSWFLNLAENRITIRFTGNPDAIVNRIQITFINANPRGNGLEWFGVINNNTRELVTSRARPPGVTAIENQGTWVHFTPPGQSIPITFNNIVTTLVTTMEGMFNNAQRFNQPIYSWDTSNVTNMRVMFSNASAFNQPIGSWNTSRVINMELMFCHPSNSGIFNQSIGSWDVSSVTNMSRMFESQFLFNSPIGNWNTSRVTNMLQMFFNARAFNQNISGWTIRGPVNIDRFRINSPLSISNTPPEIIRRGH